MWRIDLVIVCRDAKFSKQIHHLLDCYVLIANYIPDAIELPNFDIHLITFDYSIKNTCSMKLIHPAWSVTFRPYKGGGTNNMHARKESSHNPKIQNKLSLKPLIQMTIRLHLWVCLHKNFKTRYNLNMFWLTFFFLR